MRPDPGEREAWADDSDSAEFDPRVILDFLWRRKLVILLVTVPLLIPASIAPFFISPYFEATSTVVIRSTPEVMEFGADFMPRGAGDARSSYAPTANSEDALITLVLSDAVLGRVVDQLPGGGEAKQSFIDAARTAIAGPTMPPTAEQERALRVAVLRAIVDVSLAGGGNYLRITAAGTSGGTATFLANAIADAYVKYEADRREEASRRAVAWLNQQVYELREQAVRKEQALGEIVSTNNLSLGALEDARDESSNSGLDQVDSELQAARISLFSAQARLATLRPRVSRGSGGTGFDADADGGALRDQLDAATVALESARLRFTPTHPEVRRLEGIVSSLSARLGPDPQPRSHSLSPGEEAEYQRLLSEETAQLARIRVLETSRTELLASTPMGTKADAVGRYRRLSNELAIDKQILEVLMTRRNETLLTAAMKEVGADVLDYAIAPTRPAGPNRKKYLLAGWIFAFGAGFGLAFLLELIDRRLRDPQKIAELLGTTSLGMVPRVENAKAPPERQAVDAPGSAAGESYRNVRTSLLFAMRASKLQVLLVSSAIAGEGKTTTCVNLAGAFGRMGRRVVLVDADMRRPRMHRVLHRSASPGLSEILQGKARVEDAAVRPERTEFDFIPAGAIPENPSELLGSAGFSQLIADLRDEYDLIMIDSAVLLAVPDALLLAADADGTLLVSKPGSVDRHALRRIREDLHRARARVLGVVFNQVDPRNSLHYPNYMYSPYTSPERSDDRPASSGS